MHCTVANILQAVEEMAPVKNKASWDHIGFQVGRLQTQVNRVLVALDLCDEVIVEALALKAKLILVHHPLFFQPLYSLTMDDPVGKLAASLIQHDLSLIVAHTNWDAAMPGTNDALALALGLQNIHAVDENPMMRVGCLLAPEPPSIFQKRVMQALDTSVIRYSGQQPEVVQRIAVMSGAGGDYIKQASLMGVDVLVTGEIKYHEAIEAAGRGLYVVEAGHAETERISMQCMKEHLQMRLHEVQYNVDVVCSKVNQRIFGYDCMEHE